jgi:hypothetical protein
MKTLILNEFLNSNLQIHDKNKLVEYIDFCIANNDTTSNKTERHHILPKGKTLFPQFKCFKSNKWNLSILSYENHYKAHSLLAEAIKEPAITYAWHSMNSVNINNDGIEIIGESRYEELREVHRDTVIHYNKTRKLSDDTRKKMSESQKKNRNGKTFFDSTGMVPVYDTLDKVSKLIDSSEYDNKRYIHSTKNKVSVRYWNGSTGQMSKEEFESTLDIGGVTSKRYIITDNNNNTYNIMKIDKFLSDNNLPKKLKSFVNDGLIEYTPRSNNQFGKKTDINGWMIDCLD